MGSKDVVFTSEDSANTAKFYVNSAPAHTTYQIFLVAIDEANPVKLGSLPS